MQFGQLGFLFVQNAKKIIFTLKPTKNAAFIGISFEYYFIYVLRS